MPVPIETMNQFFDPLVGSPERVAAFTQQLTAAVTSPDPTKIYQSPYVRLREGIILAMQQAKEELPHDTDVQRMHSYSIFTNGESGANLTVGTLKAMSQMYMDLTTQPQHIDRVRKNVRTALQPTYNAAFTDSLRGIVNTFANMLGMNPRNPIVWGSLAIAPYLQIHDRTSSLFRIRVPGSVSPHIFRPELDAAGQLNITSRYRPLSKPGGRRCPATYAKVVTPEGPRPALLTFMHTIGNVAIDEIYPQYFDIVRE